MRAAPTITVLTNPADVSPTWSNQSNERANMTGTASLKKVRLARSGVPKAPAVTCWVGTHLPAPDRLHPKNGRRMESDTLPLQDAAAGLLQIGT